MKHIALVLCGLVAAATLLAGCGLLSGGNGAGGATGAPVYQRPSSQPGAR